MTVFDDFPSCAIGFNLGPHGVFPHQHSEQQSLDLWVGQHLLIQQNIGLRYRHLAKVRVSNSLCLYNDNMEDLH